MGRLAQGVYKEQKMIPIAPLTIDDPVNQSNLAKLKLMLDSSDPHYRVFAKYILDSPIENIYELRQAFLDEIQNVKLPPEMRPDDPIGKNDPKIRPSPV